MRQLRASKPYHILTIMQFHKADPIRLGSAWNLFILEEVDFLPPLESKTLVWLILYPSLYLDEVDTSTRCYTGLNLVVPPESSTLVPYVNYCSDKPNNVSGSYHPINWKPLSMEESTIRLRSLAT